MAVGSPSNQLLKQSEWEALFSKTKYSPSFIAEHSLKFAIALDAPIPGILKFIEALKDKKSPQFTSVATEHQLSVLIIAVMKEKMDLIEPLLDAGAKKEASDAHGWRPLHHAAVVSQDIFALLVRRGADEDALTHLNASPLDISILIGRREPTGLEERLFFRHPSGSMEPVNPKQIEQLTGLRQYRHEPLYPLEKWKDLWLTEPVRNNTDYRVPQLLRTYYRSPPKLILGSSGPTLLASRHLGVFAGENLKQFAIVSKYAGKLASDGPTFSFVEMFEQDSTEGIYRFEDLDGKEVGNISRFMNDGFPNLMAVAQHNSRGRQRQMIFVTTRAVAEGEELAWDYGSFYRTLKWGKYSLINREIMRQYFRNNKIADLVSSMSNHNSADISQNKFFELLVAPMSVYFVFNTPAALIDLTLTKTVNVDDWFLIKGYRHFLPNIVEKDSRHFYIITGLLHLLKKFNATLAKLDDRVSEDIRTFFLNEMGQLTVFQIVQGIDDIANWQGLLSQLNWERKKKEFQETLPLYNWIQDESFALYSRITQEFTNAESML